MFEVNDDLNWILFYSAIVFSISFWTHDVYCYVNVEILMTRLIETNFLLSATTAWFSAAVVFSLEIVLFSECP